MSSRAAFAWCGADMFAWPSTWAHLRLAGLRTWACWTRQRYFARRTSARNSPPSSGPAGLKVV